MIAYLSQGIAEDQRTREIRTPAKSPIAYRSHCIRNGQRSCQAFAIIESIIAYRSHGLGHAIDGLGLRDDELACGIGAIHMARHGDGNAVRVDGIDQRVVIYAHVVDE